MTRPLLLDLFCGAGGAAMGYHRAGFDVVGVDIAPQPNYPFEFWQTDALFVLESGMWSRLWAPAAIHASPPCQSYSAMSASRPGLAAEYPALIDPVRDLLMSSGVPYVIENVVGAPLSSGSEVWGTRHGAVLCGQMFGLALYRHRVFESSFALPVLPHPVHAVPASRAGHWTPGTIISVAGNVSPIAVAREAMGIDWTTRGELAEAIPPAYTEWIGAHLLSAVRERTTTSNR